MKFEGKLTALAALVLIAGQGCGEVDPGDDTATATPTAEATPTATPEPDALDFDSDNDFVVTCSEIDFSYDIAVTGWTEDESPFEPIFTIFDNSAFGYDSVEDVWFEDHVITDIDSYSPPEASGYWEDLTLDLAVVGDHSEQEPGVSTIFDCTTSGEGLYTYSLCAFDFWDVDGDEICWVWGAEAEAHAAAMPNAILVY